MAASSPLGVLLAVACLFAVFSVTDGFQCYACTYHFSGHTGITNYKCINDTARFIHTRINDCELPKICVVKTVYEQEYTRLLSSVRSCELPGIDGCDSATEIRPVCFKYCDTDLCNGLDADMKPLTSGCVNIQFSTWSIALGIASLLTTQYLRS